MRIVIVGLGQTGQEIAIELINAGHELIVIDVNKEIVDEFTNHHDAIGIVGSGASREIQLRAKVNIADVLIALSPNDEVNLMSCITAKKIGASYTIARVSREEYRSDEAYLINELGIDMIINAEYDTAKEITRIVGYPASVKTGAFANGRVDVAEIKVKEGNPLIDVKLTKLKEKFKKDIIIASIIRKGKLVIPRGDVTIQKDDELYVVSRSADIYHFLKSLNYIEKPIKSVFMVGCGNIGKYLLNNLYKMKIKIKVVEFDKERCIELAEEFPDITVVHGNGIDSDMLIEEGIKDYDCSISLTGEDETNLVVTLFAWSFKIRKLITKVVSVNYTKMLHNVSIDNTLSPHLVVLSSIHRFIRGLTDKEGEEIKSLYRFANNMAEAVEFEVSEEFENRGKALKDIKLKKDIVIAFIIRERKVIIPNGLTTMEKDDRVIVIASASKNLNSITEIIEG